MATSNLTAQRLRDLLDYDAATGDLRWRVSAGPVRAGSVAGSPNSDGYLLIGIKGRVYKAHRLAWLWMTGAWPSSHLDHIDRDRINNRFANLREVTIGENSQNRAALSGDGRIRGVFLDKKSNRWHARIAINGKRVFLGSHATQDAAALAYRAAASSLHTHNPASAHESGHLAT